MRPLVLTLSAAALVLAATASGLYAHQLRGPMMQQNQMGPDAMMSEPEMMGPGMMLGTGMMGHGMTHMMMIMMDTDGDGVLSLAEYQGVHARMFGAMDMDGDGSVTPEEMEAFADSGSSAMGEDR